jgi:thiol:disulfide interchange protein DsbD
LCHFHDGAIRFSLSATWPRVVNAASCFYSAPYIVKREWKVFGIKLAVWIAAAAGAHFITTIFLGGPPDYLVSGILVLAAIQIGLLDRTPLPAGEGKMLKRGLALLLITFAVWLETGSGGAQIPWQIYSDELLQAARKGGRPVMIDFTSKNCAPCLDMERKVFSNSRVAAAAEDFLPLRADLTELTATNAAIAERFNIEAFPTIVFIGGDGKERVNLRLVGYENARFFTERVQSAR